MGWPTTAASALAALTLATASAGDAGAQPKASQISGTASAIAAHTLKVADAQGKTQRIRLIGIDAPEMGEVPFGLWARGFLDDLVMGRPVSCQYGGGDGHDLMGGLCTVRQANGQTVDIGRTLVRAGWAWRVAALDNDQIVSALGEDEADARKNRRGLWRGYTP